MESRLSRGVGGSEARWRPQKRPLRLLAEATRGFAEVLAQSGDKELCDVAKVWEASPWVRRATLHVDEEEWEEAVGCLIGQRRFAVEVRP